MFGVVRYINYKKEQSFKILNITTKLDDALKIAFNHAKEELKDTKLRNSQAQNWEFTISNEMSNEIYLVPENKIYKQYCVIDKYIEHIEKDVCYTINYSSYIYAVIELPQIE